MICPECNGKGEAIYYVETDRDENTVTVKKIKDICHTCNGSGKKPQTNADRIRATSDEELAEWLVQKTVYQESAFSPPSYLNFFTSRDDTKENAIKGTAEWLKQPAEQPKEE